MLCIVLIIKYNYLNSSTLGCSQDLNLRSLDFSNYSQFFNNLLYLEENKMRIDINWYTMEEAAMMKDSRTSLIRLTVSASRSLLSLLAKRSNAGLSMHG